MNPNRPKTRLGVVTTWNQECGLATYASFLIPGLTKDAALILAEKAPAIKSDEANVRRVWKRGESDYSALSRCVREENIGVLHLNCHYRFFAPNFIDLLREFRSEGREIVCALHQLFTFDTDLQKLLSVVDLVLVHNRESRLEAIANGVEPKKVCILPHGVRQLEPLSPLAKSAVRNRFGISDNERLITCFGFVQAHKGMEALIEAVTHCTRAGIPCRGLIAGRAMVEDPTSAQYLEQLKNWARSAQVDSKIIFANRYLSDSEVGEILQSSDLVLMNYRSQHFESSGAAALALGAGALVITSLAPQFMGLGDAVWHLTSGYPVGPSVESLLRNQNLATTIRSRAQRFVKRHSWPVMQKRLRHLYAQYLGVEVVGVPAASNTAAPQAQAPRTVKNDGLKVLFQNRPNALSQSGGDTIVMKRLETSLKARGVEVTIDCEGKQNPADFDLVHLFNFVLPDLLKRYGEKALAANVPFVVTTLAEDVPSFHRQSQGYAEALVEYVLRGQDAPYFNSKRESLSRISPCQRLDNSWAVTNAKALMTTGGRESAIIKRDYPNCNTTVEVYLGREVKNTSASPEAFIREYGVKDFVLCVGRLESRKNQLALLKALEDSELPVVLVGGGFSYQPEYDAAARGFKRRGKTLVLGRLSDEMLESAYAACRVHALPSWYELPGLVSLEAAAFGKNVVVTDCGSTRDYLADKAFYCEPHIESSILNAILAAYYSPPMPGLKERVAEFSWEKTAQKTFEIYQSLVKQKKSAGTAGSVAYTHGVASPTAAGFASPAFAPQPALFDKPKQSSSNALPQSEWSPPKNTSPEAQDLFDTGEAAAKAMKLDEAHDYLGKAEKLGLNSVALLRARGAVYLAQNNPSDAKRYFERAYAQDAKDPKTAIGLAMCEMMDKRHDVAFPLLMGSLKEDPYNNVAILQLIECSYNLKRFADLESVLRKYLERHQSDAETKFCLAGALFMQNKLDESEAVARTVIAAKKQHEGAIVLLRKIAEKRMESLNPLPARQEGLAGGNAAGSGALTAKDRAWGSLGVSSATSVGAASSTSPAPAVTAAPTAAPTPGWMPQQSLPPQPVLQQKPVPQSTGLYTSAFAPTIAVQPTSISKELGVTTANVENPTQNRVANGNGTHNGHSGSSDSGSNGHSKQVSEKTLAPTLTAADFKLAELEDEKRKRNYPAVRAGLRELLARSLDSNTRDKALMLQAELDVVEGEVASAESVFDQIIARDNKNGRALCGKGAIEAHRGDWSRAEELFVKALELNPKNDVAYAGLGLCFAERGETDKAWTNYQKAAKANPENIRAVLGMIELGYKLQKLAEVEQAIRDYLDMHPADLDFTYALAACLFAQGRVHETQSELEKILIFNPGHERAGYLSKLIKDKNLDADQAAI